jgi:Bacterial surface proteins containing Ig-like domains
MMNKKLHTWKSALAGLLATLMVLMSAMVLPPVEANAAVAPKLTKTACNVLVGKKYDLNVKNSVKGSSLQWTTSNKKIAAVDQKGNVKGISKGTAVITCKVTTPKKQKYSLKCKVTIVKAATQIKITNQPSILNVGQKYDLNKALVPASSNDKTTWLTSDASIAKPDKNGKFVALKTGTVKITAKTLSGVKNSVTIKVVDKDGTVTNEADLKAFLASGVSTITIATGGAINITIPEGNYSKKALVVDAPKADITNYGKFASIQIKQIKSDTWFENAIGNLLKIDASNARVVVDSKASVQIQITKEGAVFKLVNNGKVEKVEVVKKADITISGDSKQAIPITITVPNVTVTSSVPLAVNCKAKAELNLLPGAEGTKVTAATKDVVPTVKGSISVDVTVEGDKGSSTVTPTPGTPGGNAGGNTGGNTSSSKTYELGATISDIDEIFVTYSGSTFSISNSTLDLLVSFLNNESASLALWKTAGTGAAAITNTYDGQTVTVSGTVGSTTKTVAFSGGKLDGKSYTVTVNNDNSVKVVNKNGIDFTVSKSSDNRSLTIKGAPTSLSFTIRIGNRYVLERPYTDLTSINITYGGKTYTVDSTILTLLKSFLNKESLSLDAWNAITSFSKSYGTSTTINISSAAAGYTKTVSFTGGQLDGKSYTVTVDRVTGNVTVVSAASHTTYVISKGTDNKSITISNAPAGLVFGPTF